jgi:choloylglycine hydrolase
MNRRRIRLISSASLILVSAASVVLAGNANACTRVLWNDNSKAVLSSRSMDWEPTTSKPVLVFAPRGIARTGNTAGVAKVSMQNPARWTSKFGSVFVTAEDSGTADGMNEKGLAAHVLWLNATKYGTRDTALPGVNVGMWAQYILDNASTVDQAIAAASKIQVTPLMLGETIVPLSLAVEDPTGDSAVFQYIDGKLVIHHGRDVRVLSNDPPYDEALKLLNPDGYAGYTRLDPLPGNTNSADRFVRANFYLDFLRRTRPATLEAAKAGLMSVARNVSDPIGAPMDTPGSVDETDYRTLSDLTHRTYSFEPTRRLALLVTDLSKMDFRAGQPVRTLNPLNPKLNGDVTSRYIPVARGR